MLTINNEATLDDYAALLTLESKYGGRLVYVVANNSAVVRFRPLVELGGSEGAAYGAEQVLTPSASFVEKVSGVQFRSAVAGNPARVIATLSEPGDVLPASGTPFTQTLAASGAASTTGIGAMQLISDQLLTVAAAEISFASIPATFAHLLLAYYLRGDTAAATTALNLQFNADTGANYDIEVVLATAAAPAGAEVVAGTSLPPISIPAATAPAGQFGIGQLMVPHYAGSIGFKSLVGTFGYRSVHAGGGGPALAAFGDWRNTAALNRIRLFPTAGSFIAGSRITLYGLAV